MDKFTGKVENLFSGNEMIKKKWYCSHTPSSVVLILTCLTLLYGQILTSQSLLINAICIDSYTMNK